jgi:hypothetical protein
MLLIFLQHGKVNASHNRFYFVFFSLCVDRDEAASNLRQVAGKSLHERE